MKNQPDTGIDAVHTRLAIAWRQPEVYGPWAIDLILAECPDAECEECARIVCPFHEPLHFHHDGCPACAESSMRCHECGSARIYFAEVEKYVCESCGHKGWEPI